MRIDHTLGTIGLIGLVITTVVLIPIIVGTQVAAALHPLIGLAVGLVVAHAIIMAWATATDKDGAHDD